jgi:hypothetical protein
VCPSCMPMIGGPVVLSGYSGFFHHYNWSPWYSWNIVGSRLASILHTRLKAYRLSELNLFAHAQTLYRMSSLCRSYECMNIVRVNIECFNGTRESNSDVFPSF